MKIRDLIKQLEALPDKDLPVELYDRHGVEILRPQADSLFRVGGGPVREIVIFTESE